MSQFPNVRFLLSAASEEQFPTDAGTESQDIGFRCCHGAPNAAVVSEPKAGATFAKAKLTAEELQRDGITT